jgi:hypothetical protein
MPELSYRLWREAGLVHWAVFVDSRSVGRGAATDTVKARTEAMLFLSDPTLLAEIDAWATQQQTALSIKRSGIAVSSTEREIPDLAASCACDRRLITQSRDAISDSRRILDQPLPAFCPPPRPRRIRRRPEIARVTPFAV